EGIFDSGSTVIQMSVHMARRAEVRWDSAATITLAGPHGTTAKALGLARNVLFDVNSCVVKVQAYIFDTRDYDILLGMPFFLVTSMYSEMGVNGVHCISLHDPEN
ncbi:hypothetical protein BV22DRAFT_987660, partial [Leucogyrophana mollusca]